jgi:endonuclease/exonuclease/phosphatase (EEP) superfamily protein YafD
MTIAPDDTTAQRQTYRRRARSPWTKLAIVASLGLAVVTALAWAARYHWALELLSHFPVQIALATLAPLLLLLAAGERKLAILPLVVLIANAWRPAACYLPVQTAPRGGKTLRVVAANVLSKNRRHEDFIRFIRTSKPDFFFVLEMNRDWLDALRELENDYPHSVVAPREDNFGIGLFSRVEIKQCEIHITPGPDVPSIIAILDLGDGELTVVGTHPLPPDRRRSHLRNLQLEDLGRMAAELPLPKVLVGDLNVTPWSPYFADLLRQTQMRDARRGFGIQPSWPNFIWPLRIPIDHTLVSHDIHVVDRWLGPNIGSDHLAVVMDFQVTAPGPTRP